MKIRNAHLKDEKEILGLLIRTPELQGYGEIDAIYSEDYVIDCIKDKEMNLVLVVEEDNKMVGLLIAEIWDKKGRLIDAQLRRKVTAEVLEKYEKGYNAVRRENDWIKITPEKLNKLSPPMRAFLEKEIEKTFLEEKRKYAERIGKIEKLEKKEKKDWKKKKAA